MLLFRVDLMRANSNPSSPKRALSHKEQGTITQRGKALIFPGPGAPEIDELIRVGFDLEDIYCVDIETNNINYVAETYPFIPSSNLYAGKALRCSLGELTQIRWSYVHLDYEVFLSNENVRSDIRSIAKSIAPGGRLKVTVIFRQPRNNHTPAAQQYRWPDVIETRIHNDIWFYGFERGKFQTYPSPPTTMISTWFDRKL